MALTVTTGRRGLPVRHRLARAGRVHAAHPGPVRRLGHLAGLLPRRRRPPDPDRRGRAGRRARLADLVARSVGRAVPGGHAGGRPRAAAAVAAGAVQRGGAVGAAGPAPRRAVAAGAPGPDPGAGDAAEGAGDARAAAQPGRGEGRPEAIARTRARTVLEVEVAAVEEPATGLAAPAAVRGLRGRRLARPRTPAWSIRADEHDVYEPAPVPVPVGDEVHGFVRAPDPETTPAPAAEVVAAAVPRPGPAPAAARTAAEPPAGPRADKGGHFPTDPQRAESNGGGRAVPAGDEVDPHAALERRILLPARKDR